MIPENTLSEEDKNELSKIKEIQKKFQFIEQMNRNIYLKSFEQ